MAEVTYYFNAYVTPVWSDPDNLIDGDIGTFGYTNAKKTAQTLTGNTCPAEDLGTITKVQIRIFAYGDGNDRIDITPIFAGGNGYVHPRTPVVSPGDWTGYVDITNDPNAPDWSLWSHIQDLDCIIDSVAVSKGNTLYCSKVEIRVTYFIPPDIDVGADPIDRINVYGSTWTIVGKDNPANASGTLHTVKIWANDNMTGLRVGTFYTTNGNTLKCRDSVVLGNVVAGAERTFTELSITVVEGDYIGCWYGSGSIERDASGFAGMWYATAEYIDPGDEAEYALLEGDAISLYGYGDIVGGQDYPRSAAVIIGILPAASRSTTTTRASSVILGVLTTASRAIAITRASSVIAGIVVTASRARGIPRASSVIIGIVTTAVRSISIDRASSVLVGIVVSATRAIATTRASSIIVGILVSASKIWNSIQPSSVIVGILATASKVFNSIQPSSVIVGVKTTATRAITISRVSSTIVGIVATASKVWNSVKPSSVLVGLLTTASRAVTYSKTSAVLVGILTTASRAISTVRASSVIVGVLVAASRSITTTRASSVLVGIVATATRILGKTREATVSIGTLVTAIYFTPRKFLINVITSQYRKIRSITYREQND